MLPAFGHEVAHKPRLRPGVSPSMSCSTSTCPSQPAPAPMPIVGTRERAVKLARRAPRERLEHEHRGAGVGELRAWRRSGAAPSSSRPWTRQPPSACTDCGVRPRWPHTGMPRSTRKRTVSARPAAAFELDHLRAGLHQTAALRKRLLARLVVAGERQVGDQPGVAVAARHAARVVRHLVERHRQGAVVPLQHHAERIADQQHVDAGRVEQRARSWRRSRSASRSSRPGRASRAGGAG